MQLFVAASRWEEAVALAESQQRRSKGKKGKGKGKQGEKGGKGKDRDQFQKLKDLGLAQVPRNGSFTCPYYNISSGCRFGDLCTLVHECPQCPGQQHPFHVHTPVTASERSAPTLYRSHPGLASLRPRTR